MKWLAGLVFAVGLLGYGARVAVDAHLQAPTPTAIVTDASSAFITQAGHESVRPGGGRQVEYGYWPVSPPAPWHTPP